MHANSRNFEWVLNSKKKVKTQEEKMQVLNFLVILSSLFSLAFCYQYNQDTDPQAFIEHCRSPDRISCNSYECYAKSLEADLRLMDNLRCITSRDCLHSSTGLVCLKYSNGKSFCECPRKQGFNVTSCSCEAAQACPDFSEDHDNQTSFGQDHRPCHNGMECSDNGCSCTDLSRSLYESTGMPA